MRPPLIIGGGPAGAAAACLLARAGAPPTLLERLPGPADKVCGDFVSAEAIAMLQDLGIDLPALHPAHIATLRVVHGRRVAEIALPFPALGLTRRALDEALLQRAAQLGATVRRGHAVRSLQAGPHGIHIRSDLPTGFAGEAVFLATGKHELRGVSRPTRTLRPLGLKTYFDLAPDQAASLQGAVELVLLRDGYAGLQCVEFGRVVLCLVTGADRMRHADGNWPMLLAELLDEAPHLRLRLRGARDRLPRPLAIAGIPYGHLQLPDPHEPGLFRLGDQGCVIPSLTGDGVAIALHSAVLAVAVWQSGGDAVTYHRTLARQLRRQMRIAGLIHGLCGTRALQPLLAAAARACPAAVVLAARSTRIAACESAGNKRPSADERRGFGPRASVS